MALAWAPDTVTSAIEAVSQPGSWKQRVAGTLQVPSAVASASQAGSPSRQTIWRLPGVAAASPTRHPARQRGRGSAEAEPGPPNKQAEAAIKLRAAAVALRRLFPIVSSPTEETGSGEHRPRTPGALTRQPSRFPSEGFYAGISRTGLLARDSLFSGPFPPRQICTGQWL